MPPQYEDYVVLPHPKPGTIPPILHLNGNVFCLYDTGYVFTRQVDATFYCLDMNGWVQVHPALKMMLSIARYDVINCNRTLYRVDVYVAGMSQAIAEKLGIP